MALMETANREELEKLIDRAIKKIQGGKENDLCKYLPGPKGGYMHHFTMRKLKNTDPQQLVASIKNFIINSDKPAVIEPKKRAPRGSRKERDTIHFSRADIEKILELARQVGDKELLTKFSPKRSLPTLKRELMRSIRQETVNQDLWNAYTEVITAQKND